jgi:hypothetical protein
MHGVVTCIYYRTGEDMRGQDRLRHVYMRLDLYAYADAYVLFYAMQFYLPPTLLIPLVPLLIVVVVVVVVTVSPVVAGSWLPPCSGWLVCRCRPP